MNRKSFQDYVQLRESDEKKDNNDPTGGPLNSKIILGDGNDFEPFMVSADPKSEHYGKNKNIAAIIRAFKGGANWGWSKDDNSGEDKPVKITGKKLFLTGGSVRDHLKGKKPRNMELATNASPDEVYHLLKQNGFEFVDDPVLKPKGKKQIFWVKKANKVNRPFSFGIKVHEDEFDLEIFTKTPKGKVAGEPESGTHAEDAAGRDFTINAMSILLTNDNGPNKELHDFYGGMHHLKSGRIQAVGDMAEKFKEDPSRILRYVRMLSSYGDPKKISEEDKIALKKTSDKIGKLDQMDVMDEFKKGLNKDDVDSRSYLKLFKDLGLLGNIFPGKVLDTDLPKELSELGDKHMPLAWMLRNNDPKSLDDSGLDPEVTQKIGFLIKSLGMSENIDGDSLEDIMNGFRSSGISSRKLKDWASKLGGVDSTLIDAFVNHAKSPRVKTMIMGDDGQETVSDEFLDLFDPFSGEPSDHKMVEQRKKEKELGNFKKQLEFMRPM